MCIRDSVEADEVFYTNSTHIPYEADVDPIERVVREGRFHPFIKAGAITHVWMGEHKPDAKALASFVRKIFLHSQNAQVAFSPEFTICNDCGIVERGLLSSCNRCRSTNVDGAVSYTHLDVYKRQTISFCLQALPFFQHSKRRFW